ncbi:MAG: IPT/TIG domain-containing protein, partial [Opitutaceae bacterium]|nr:IPT/TIG domain-containing protein [Opitutaceae bacterium]
QSSRWGNGAENPRPADPADPAPCNKSLNIWSIDPVDLLAGGTTWRFDGNLVERRGIILGGAQVGADLDYYKDGYHPGGSIVDEAAGQQHIFIYIGVYTQYANAYRLSRPLDTYAFRAACGLPALPTPAITGVSISGKTITIAGINFTALKEVLIDGKSAAIVSSNITEINATLPDGVTTATADEVTVRTNHGITTGLSDLTQLPPAVSAIRYDAIWPGKPVTITGVNLDDVTKIFFGDIEVTTFISKTDTEIVVAAPEGVTDGVLSLQAAGGDTVPLPISGEYTASVKPYDLAPLVDTQPVVAGYHPLDLVASATGTPTPTYKWQYRNGGTGDWTDVGMSLDYEGVSTAHLTIVNTTGRNGWQYRYVAMNHTEDVYSNPVTLQLLAETFIAPAGIVAASDSDAPDLYIADAHAIYVVTQSNQKALVFAGQSDESGNSDGASDIARFNAPRGLTLDATGRLIVADTGNSRIRAIAPDGAVSTISASHVFDGPRDVVAHNTNGDIYVADTGNHLIKKIDSTGAVYIIAGGGVAGFSDGVGPEVLFNTPSGIAIDNDGDLYVADTGNHAIRHIDMVTGSVSLFAGGTTPGTTDGAVASARFDSPESVAVDNITGRIYVADTGKHRIRVIHSGSVLSIAGQYPGTAGFKDDTMSDTLTVNNGWLASPSAITAGGTRTFYIADTGNTVIRRYRGVTTGEIITLPIEALPADSGTSGGNNGDGGNSGGGGGGGAPSWLFAAALAALLAPRVLINKSRQ